MLADYYTVFDMTTKLKVGIAPQNDQMGSGLFEDKGMIKIAVAAFGALAFICLCVVCICSRKSKKE